MKFLKQSFFANQKNRSPKKRASILHVGKKANFHTFGKTYFDGKKAYPGYGGYTYDSRFSEPVKKLVDRLKLDKNDKIIELGCAKGFILYEFWKLGFRNILGQDVSNYAIKNSKTEIKGMLMPKCISKIEAKDNSVKLLFSKEVLPHLSIQKMMKTFNEISRVIKDDGIIYLEIQTGSDKQALNKMRLWDPTHKIVKTKNWWEKILKKRLGKNKNVFVYFKNLF